MTRDKKNNNSMTRKYRPTLDTVRRHVRGELSEADTRRFEKWQSNCRDPRLPHLLLNLQQEWQNEKADQVVEEKDDTLIHLSYLFDELRERGQAVIDELIPERQEHMVGAPPDLCIKESPSKNGLIVAGLVPPRTRSVAMFTSDDHSNLHVEHVSHHEPLSRIGTQTHYQKWRRLLPDVILSNSEQLSIVEFKGIDGFRPAPRANSKDKHGRKYPRIGRNREDLQLREYESMLKESFYSDSGGKRTVVFNKQYRLDDPGGRLTFWLASSTRDDGLRQLPTMQDAKEFAGWMMSRDKDPSCRLCAHRITPDR